MVEVKGLGLWAWVLDRIHKGDVPAMAAEAKALSASRVLIKASDGISTQNRQTATKLATALAERGIKTWAWAYLYDRKPDEQANILVTRARSMGAEAVVLNVEKEFSDDSKPVDEAALEALLVAVRSQWAGPLAVSSYGRITHFPGWPWHLLRKHGVLGMPQVYGFSSEEHARARIRVAVENYAQLGVRVIPTFGAWVDDSFDHSWREVRGCIAETAALAGEGLCEPAADAWSWQHFAKHPEADSLLDVLSNPAKFEATGPARTFLLPDSVKVTDSWQHKAALMRLGLWGAPLFGSHKAWDGAVKAYQKARGLTPDGAIGPKTHAVLRAEAHVNA